MATNRSGERAPFVLRAIAIGLAILVAGGIVGWATAVMFRPATNPVGSLKSTFFKSAEGEVGSSFGLNVVAQWNLAPVAENSATGVVTSVTVGAGQLIDQGAVLYSVNLRPVVAAQGPVPQFRSLQSGSSGPDVQQLQVMLAKIGFYHGAQDGKYGSATAASVKVWQRSLGEQPDGVVHLGDVVYIPSLPARISLDPKIIARGLVLSGNEPAMLGLSTAPALTLPVTAAQATLIPNGTRIEITAPGGRKWETYATAQTSSTDQVTISVSPKSGASTCLPGCESIPVAGQTILPSKVIVVEPTKGIVVPTAALVTTTDGAVLVTLKSGRRVPVHVTSSARGMSVVTGIGTGITVRVPVSSG